MRVETKNDKTQRVGQKTIKRRGSDKRNDKTQRVRQKTIKHMRVRQKR